MTIKDKPTVRKTDIVDSLDGITSVEQMYNIFVKPIDQNIRSFKNSGSLGIKTQNGRTDRTEQEQFASQALSGGSVDPLYYNESRCHAFYRNIGFPVVSPDGVSFYNSGHDPKQIDTIRNRLEIHNKIYSDPNNTALTVKREDYFNTRKDIFSRQDENSSIYALLLRKPRPFLTAQTGKDPFFIDEQKTIIDSRKQEINNLTLKSVPDIITNVPHILKPFVVDASIEFAVAPEQYRRVAVPFLGSPDDLVTGKDDEGGNISVYRPIIEQIIMHRLKIQETDSDFISAAQNILNTKSGDESVKSTLLALSGSSTLDGVDQSIISSIQDFTTLESQIATNLIKCIKVAVGELINSVKVLEQLKAQSNYQPIPGQDGPEFPQNGKVRVSGGYADTSESRKKQALLELQELLNNRELVKTDERVGSNAYSGGISVDIKKNFKPALDDMKRKEDEQSRQILNNIANIEKITGEVSGLGIVDILGIYTALYTIDMKYLIGFLDNNSLNRLFDNFNELVNDEVKTQKNGSRPSIKDCLREFEKTFFNILAFADSLIVSTSQTPTKARKGTTKGG